MDAGLGASRKHGVGVAALDHLGRLSDRGRSCRAGRDGRVIRAAEAERDRELATRGVDEDVREEGRGDAIEAPLAQHVVLLHELDEAADRRAEEDPDAVRRVHAVEASVRDSLPRGAEREEHVAVEPPRVLRRGDLARVEVRHLRCDPHGELARVEGLGPDGDYSVIPATQHPAGDPS